MQPLNEKLDALREPKAKHVEAEATARKWIKFNTVRIVMPLVAGCSALWATLKSM
ncbi:uncharacterized protein BCR38DRAFT_423626 [Pseudomassariella vexata]|uniref:Uncharacterized protein n=1 Tax=Pseudomassariella vexata TaxID=1141098 RepID=A0A1Y2EBB8_9PEZI|nr:uncharacterized protein BCR38DRAFT_423626 [Pseudomassariella vexata]ORY68556.1 hypothetical protein BCR38DRAFT_423626 [Pseudomassariella vexata]